MSQFAINVADYYYCLRRVWTLGLTVCKYTGQKTFCIIFTIIKGHVTAARKRSHRWCVFLTPNNAKTIERMTCHCFLRPIRRDLPSSKVLRTVLLQLFLACSLSEYSVSGLILSQNLFVKESRFLECSKYISNWICSLRIVSVSGVPYQSVNIFSARFHWIVMIC